MEDHPPSKKRKLSLSEVPSIISAALETTIVSGDFDFAKWSSQNEGTVKEQAEEDVCLGAGPEDRGSRQLTAAMEHPEDHSITSKNLAGGKETATRVGHGQWVSQEMEDENTQIQSSLPLYLDHVFGQGLGMCRETPPKQHNSTDSAADECRPAVPMESQGFLPTFYDHVEESTRPLSPKEVRIEAPVSPLLFDSPSPESSPNKESPNSQNINASSATSHCTAGSTSSKDYGNTILPSEISSVTANKYENLQDGAIVRNDPTCINNTQKAVTVCKTVSYNRGGRKRRHLPGCQKKLADEKYTCPPTCTCLADCTEAGKNVCLFVIVLQVNCVMEVACRGGSMAGQTVQMSSLLLGDPTKSYFKLSLWREAALWVERIAVGDIVYFTNIRLKRWQRESVGHTVMCSTVLNLHLPKKELPTRVRQTIPPKCLDLLKRWAMKQHGYLFADSSPTPKSQMLVYFKMSHELGMFSVVHFRAKLLTVLCCWQMSLRKKSICTSLVLRHLCGTVSSAVESGKYGSSSISALLQMERKEAMKAIELKVSLLGLLEQFNTAIKLPAGCYSLQTTSRSQLRNLKSDCDMASDILQRFPSGHTGFINKSCSIEEILTTKESGTFECQARALSLRFQLEDGSKLLIGSLLQLSSLEVVSQLCHAVYIGCESCSKPLQQDINGVYCQCISCMSQKPGGYPTSSHYFRPLTVVLHDGLAHVEVVASHTIISKIFDVNPSSIAKASLAQDLVQCQELAENLKRTDMLVQSSVEENLWIISCTFTKDENSFLESVSISLLDWQHV